MCDSHLQPDPCQDLDTGEEGAGGDAMTTDELPPEIRAALVAILRRAAHRGRELRRSKQAIDGGGPVQDARRASPSRRQGATSLGSVEHFDN
jgi:hypothetical protein